MVKYNYSRKEGGIVLIYYIKNMKLANEWNLIKKCQNNGKLNIKI